MRVNEESKNASLKLKLKRKQRTNIMASSPIISGQTEGENVESEMDFLLLGSKITADGGCSHEIKWLLPGRESMTKTKKVCWIAKHHLPTKVWMVKAMVFPGVTYDCESWSIKKAECRKINAFKPWCWRDSWEPLGQQGGQNSQS